MAWPLEDGFPLQYKGVLVSFHDCWRESICSVLLGSTWLTRMLFWHRLQVSCSLSRGSKAITLLTPIRLGNGRRRNNSSRSEQLLPFDSAWCSCSSRLVQSKFGKAGRRTKSRLFTSPERGACRTVRGRGRSPSQGRRPSRAPPRSRGCTAPTSTDADGLDPGLGGNWPANWAAGSLELKSWNPPKRTTHETTPTTH